MKSAWLHFLAWKNPCTFLVQVNLRGDQIPALTKRQPIPSWLEKGLINKARLAVQLHFWFYKLAIRNRSPFLVQEINRLSLVIVCYFLEPNKNQKWFFLPGRKITCCGFYARQLVLRYASALFVHCPLPFSSCIRVLRCLWVVWGFNVFSQQPNPVSANLCDFFTGTCNA